MSAEQRTAEWFAERAGKVTCSRLKDVLTRLKSGAPSEKRTTYMWELVLETITGSAAEHYASAAMQWGEDQEEWAQMAYAARTGAMVEKAGFIVHPRYPRVGGSPDGLVGIDGGWEGKCPFNSINHLQTIVNGMPFEHMPQVQGLMWVTGRQWWDFTSADSRLPEPFHLYVERIPRDEAFIANLEVEVPAFLREVDATLARLGVNPAPKMNPAITDEAVALLRLDNATDPDEAAAVLDLCRGEHFHARLAAMVASRFPLAGAL